MAGYLIRTPVPLHTGPVGDVDFIKGEATIDGDKHAAELAYFRAQGYVVEQITPADVPAEIVGDDDGNPATPPPGNASADAWREHALAIGATEDQVKDLSRDQLKELAAKLTEGPIA
jgi:hypothetical protein